MEPIVKIELTREEAELARLALDYLHSDCIRRHDDKAARRCDDTAYFITKALEDTK